MFDLIVRNVKVLFESKWLSVELGVKDGNFVEIAPNISGNSYKEFDGKGAFCLPGAVDLHVHFNEPGRTHWEGFRTGSAAAAAAGISFVAEMPLNSLPSTTSVDALKVKLTSINNRSYVDYGLWGGVVPGNLNCLLPLAEAGVIGFKAFMSPSGNDDFLQSGRSTLCEAMKRIASTELRLALHAEDPLVLERASNRLKRSVSAYDWDASRPVEAEISATKLAIELSIQTHCPITIVHVSSAEVLTVIENAKRQGVDIMCETCPHYILLSRADADRIGADAKCAPPLRSQARSSALEQALLSGRIDTIGSDHSPCPPDLKLGKSFFEAWGGIAGIQHGYPLLLNRYNFEKSEVIELLQQLSSQNPAEIMAIHTKGCIGLDKNADFILIEELSEDSKILEDSLLTKHCRSPYLGSPSHVKIASTWLRGQIVSLGSKLCGVPRGQFMSSSNG